MARNLSELQASLLSISKALSAGALDEILEGRDPDLDIPHSKEDIEEIVFKAENALFYLISSLEKLNKITDFVDKPLAKAKSLREDMIKVKKQVI